MESGLVFNVQRFSVSDGPGLRTTVFLKGCPARCPWCHNPESQSRDPELITIGERCVSCGNCRTVCPRGADPDRCTACGTCVSGCPADARQLAGRTMTVRDVLDIVVRDRIFYEESGGGVTFSGGEPLAQPRFLYELLAGAREEGIATAVDTCGFAPRDVLLRMAPLVDLFLYDVKMLDHERHLTVIGVPLSPILANLEALARARARIWLRVPVVPSVTDSLRELEGIARLAAGYGAERVSLLPYHATGAGKLARLRRPQEGALHAVPDLTRMNDIAMLFRARGVDVRIGA